MDSDFVTLIARSERDALGQFVAKRGHRLGNIFFLAVAGFVVSFCVLLWDIAEGFTAAWAGSPIQKIAFLVRLPFLIGNIWLKFWIDDQVDSFTFGYEKLEPNKKELWTAKAGAYLRVIEQQARTISSFGTAGLGLLIALAAVGDVGVTFYPFLGACAVLLIVYCLGHAIVGSIQWKNAEYDQALTN